MADKTTTLKTKTNDNVYPNVIGDNRKNAFVDSSTITHHFYDKTHKVGFQIANETNIKIQNSLQKPAGLTKTKLVGVGTNGQENIEIGDNLTLANGKLSATGGGGSGGDAFDVINLSKNRQTYTGTITGKNPVLLKSSTDIYIACYVYEWTYSNPHQIHAIFMFPSFGSLLVLDCYDNNVSVTEVKYLFYSHFITMADSSSNVSLYLIIQNTSGDEFTADTLAEYLADKKVLANGNLYGVVPTYIAGEGGVINIYYMTPGDSDINPTPDEYQDLSSFTITDLVTPVE
jgi:hypothetical protein